MAAFVGALLLSQEIERSENVCRRIFRNRGDAFELPDHVFVRCFRLDNYLVLYITKKIASSLTTNGLPPHVLVLICLRFFATGSYQHLVGNDLFLTVSQKSVSRCIAAVSLAITNIMMPEWIKFPDLAQQSGIKQRYNENSSMPGVIGSIDCTHVAIVKPSEDSNTVREASYVNRKGFHSINVQLVVDDRLMIHSINAKFPGSVHDAFVWRTSAVRNHLMDHLSNTQATGWLSGDSGYPLEPWLLTPFADPLPGTAESKFNKCHSRTRSTVERCNGHLKSRFRCLLKHRVLHYAPTQASCIINACAVLHNLCTERGLPVEEIDEHFIDDFPIENTTGPLLNAGQRLRQRIANTL